MLNLFVVIPQQGLDVDTKPSLHSVEAMKALRTAIRPGDLSACIRLLDLGIGIESRIHGCHGCTSLMYSLYMRREAIAEYFATKGALPTGKACSHFNRPGYTAFHCAAEANYRNVLRTLIEKHPSQYIQLVHTFHPIFLAIIVQSIECVELMIEYAIESKMNRLIRCFNGLTPIIGQIHLSDGSLGPNKCLNAQLLNLETSDRTPSGLEVPPMFRDLTPLMIAVVTGNVKIAKRLLEAGTMFNRSKKFQETCLHTPVATGNVGMIEFLLDHGANSQLRDEHMLTPTMVAAEKGNSDVLQALIKRGADVLAKDPYENSLLHVAANAGSVKVFCALYIDIENFNLAEKNKCGETALALAYHYFRGHGLLTLLNLAPRYETYDLDVLACAATNPDITLPLVKMLLRRLPPDLIPKLLQHEDLIYGTPLYAACTYSPHGQIAIIDLLLDAGAELEADGGQYGTALMSACTVGRLQAVKDLVRKGAMTTYLRQGQPFSALRAAKHFPDIIRWLLVGKFVGEPNLLITYGENW